MLSAVEIKAMTDDELVVVSFFIDQKLDALVDDETSPLWDERAFVDREIARRGLG